MFGIVLDNCSSCLYNVFREMDKLPPFEWKKEEKSDKKTQLVL
jgi:hypothetical protein